MVRCGCIYLIIYCLYGEFSYRLELLFCKIAFSLKYVYVHRKDFRVRVCTGIAGLFLESMNEWVATKRSKSVFDLFATLCFLVCLYGHYGARDDTR